MNITFLKEMIKNRWEDHTIQPHTSYWNDAIKKLSINELQQLISICLECLGIRLRTERLPEVVLAVQNETDFRISSDLIDVDQKINRKIMANILECIMISEYKLDSILLLPSDMRSERLQVLADSLNIEKNLIIDVDNHWRKLSTP